MVHNILVWELRTQQAWGEKVVDMTECVENLEVISAEMELQVLGFGNRVHRSL